MKTFLFVYFGSAFFAVMITPIVIKLARRIKAIDRPGVRTTHTRPIPRIGGVALFISAMSFIVIILFLNNAIGEAFRNTQLHLITLFCSASLVFLIGLIDDLRGLPARFKFLTELLVASLLCIVGVRITSIAITEQWSLTLGLFGYPLSILWIVGITNAVNLSDGLDGLAAGISAIACGVIAIFAIYSGNVLMAVLMLALLGSLSGFLFFNFNPAKIFMGDCGSLFLGFMIASSSVLCSMKSSALVGLALPVLALGIPIFDTLFSMLRRFLERRSLFASDRRHFHHRLIDLGLKQRHAVITIYVVTFLATGLGLFMMVTRDINSLVIFLCILLLLLLVFHVVGSVRLRETIKGLQRKYAIARQMQQEKKNFDDVELYFRRAVTFSEWWQAVLTAAEVMDFLNLSLPLTNRDGSDHILTWEQERQPSKSNNFEVLKVNIPVRDRRAGLGLNLKIEVCQNGSLESAGRRIALFTRLIEEHSIISLPGNKKIQQFSECKETAVR